MERRSVERLIKEASAVVELPIEYFWGSYLDTLANEQGIYINRQFIIKNPTLAWSLEKNFQKWVEAQGGEVESSNWTCIRFKNRKKATVFCLKWGHKQTSDSAQA